MLNECGPVEPGNGSSLGSNCSQLEIEQEEDEANRRRREELELAIVAAAAEEVECVHSSLAAAAAAADIDSSQIETVLGDIRAVSDVDLIASAAAEEAGGMRNEEQEEEEEVSPSYGNQQPPLVCRTERSNSCSQAELGAATEAHAIAAAAGVGALSTSMLDNKDLVESVFSQQQQTTTSASQENLAQNKFSNQIPTIASSASTSNLIDLQFEAGDCSTTIVKSNNYDKNNQLKQQPQQQQQQQQQQQSTSSSYYASSSRFFSSKLNTGSLWSLLSVGSNSSYSDQAGGNSTTTSNDNNNMDGNVSCKQENKSSLSSSTQTTVGAFFSRNLNQFKRNNTVSAQHNDSSSQQQNDVGNNTIRDKTNSTNETSNQQQVGIRRFRFNNIKYIGSTILHKNFTLPMLEWIAKDIKRQTIKGAQCISQRQFNIPSREIIFEIQSNSYTAISCKDGHPIFIHPMHCVSKYVQLQHDQTCFAYFIRDTKESPYYCHVFQAKSASKVHDIFQAIREATTTTAAAAAAQLQSNPSSITTTSIASGSAATTPLLKSLSTDGSSLLYNNNSTDLKNNHVKQQQQPNSPLIVTTHQSSSNSLISNQHHQQQQAAAAAAAHQFEDSYQFEVMFVKKVKLQCRRVPSSFVDDALETLKSFEVMKGGVESKANQIKGSVGKRPIINASVDERQEYDEACQSPTPGSGPGTMNLQQHPHHHHHHHQKLADVSASKSSSTESNSEKTNSINETSNPRRGSSASCHKLSVVQGNECEQSRSCQQSPTKLDQQQQDQEQQIDGCEDQQKPFSIREQMINMKKHQSMDCLKSIADFSIKTAKAGNAPNYTNDFSPYSTITSNDLNERIAAIPVVSTSSVSLDHETRQKLARQVRETIMATAASIKKDVYASGDKLDSSSTSKALDSLSCTVTSSVPPVFNTDDIDPSALISDNNLVKTTLSDSNYWLKSDQRRSSAGPTTTTTTTTDASTNHIITNGLSKQQQTNQSASNNFDLFRRASARQVVKNRTMLLLIGKDELCTISIDKHQMLFSKSFNSIVLCLQGNNNKDHFGIICRDSGKINPQTESYAGFIFKCQSDKVAREIMGALKQVIYNSQHNQYHGITSPYNPLNTSKFKTPTAPTSTTKANSTLTYEINSSPSSSIATTQAITMSAKQSPVVSLAAKRGFMNSIDLDEAARQSMALESILSTTPPTSSYPFQMQPHGVAGSAGNSPALIHQHHHHQQQQQQQPKNLIKSMFCDNCPLYWYHRLCCDIESMPADASKTIILRRIDTSLPEKEQDEVYSKFSEFNIETIDEHNEIFMSLLRHLAERKQLKHNQSISHQNAMAKNLASLKQQHLSMSSSSSSSGGLSTQKSFIPISAPSNTVGTSSTGTTTTTTSEFNKNNSKNTHQRSGSTSGSLAFVLNQSSNAANQSIVDASTAAIDNLKKAKNSFSISIENMLKRRSSLKDAENNEELEIISTSTTNQHQNRQPTRTGSFKLNGSSRPNTRTGLAESSSGSDHTDNNKQPPLKRSQSTSDYSNEAGGSSTTINDSFYSTFGTNWKNSLVNRTMNYKYDDLSSIPIVGLFRRRGSSFGSKNDELAPTLGTHSQRTSTDCLNSVDVENSTSSPYKQPGSPTCGTTPTLNRFMFPLNNPSHGIETGGGSSPSSLLSSAFWKKSIFDKIRQPTTKEQQQQQQQEQQMETREIYERKKEICQKQNQQDNKEQRSPKKTSEELRALWRKAILEQITLIKMDKQNQRLQASAVQCDTQGIKLNYRDVPYTRDVLGSWDRLLKQDPTKKVEFVEVARLVRAGVPKQRRGEVWMFLMNQYQLRHGTCFQPADSEFRGDANQAYRSLLSQLSVQQHEIFVDIGRTFPTHPYYSQYLSIGQLSLFNLLKAYSLLDQEVGYCQGLSFVAGILLLHVNSEDEAFELMRHLLFNFGLRKQYLPSMNALHLQLYQLTRLLRDYEFELFSHFDKHDISPSLYAAPWFLTIFASQFPLNFVARLLDLVFLIGIEAIFRVSLNLLTHHKDGILNCQSLESTMDYMRNELIKIGDDKNLIKLFDKSMSLDLRNKLIEYEIEYTFYCAEDKARSGNHHHHHHSYSKSSSSSSAADNRKARSKNDRSNNFSKTQQDIKEKQQRSSAERSESDLISSESIGKNIIDSNETENLLYDKKNNYQDDVDEKLESSNAESTSVVADATATVIIQHLLANNHLKSLRTNYSY